VAAVVDFETPAGGHDVGHHLVDRAQRGDLPLRAPKR
jgi:hypothetical protein